MRMRLRTDQPSAVWGRAKEARRDGLPNGPRLARNRELQRTRRRGLATLELAMVLPFLVILAGILFSVARASLIRGEAILKARHQAWHNRYGHGSGGSLGGAGMASALGALTNTSAASGLQSGSGSKSARVQKLAPANQFFSFGSITANASHEVFSGPWDHEAIPYESQPRLGLDRRVFVYALGGGAGGMNGLHGMLDFLNAPDSGAVNQLQNAISKIGNQLDALDREIRFLEDQLRTLRQLLSVATDNAVIRDLERQIERLESILRKVREAREKLTMGLNLIGR